MVIGITGGVGSGKSYVLSIMEKHFGAYVLSADTIAHQLMEPGGNCYKPVLEQFGEQIIKEDGTVDRKLLAEIVFVDEELLGKLNGIIHPRVKEEIKKRIKTSLLENPRRLIVIEAALLLEDHYDEICDEIWYIYAEEEIRRKRLKESRNYTDEKIASIMKNQLSKEEFEQRCQRSIYNNRGEAWVIMQIEKALK